MAALARASHPALYERGWHPTAVCGTVGAASTAAALLRLRGAALESALALALLRAGGPRAGFGSDGKALGVGLAAADGVQAARLAASGARMPLAVVHGPSGFEAVTGGTWAAPGAGDRAGSRAQLDQAMAVLPDGALGDRGGAGRSRPSDPEARRRGTSSSASTRAPGRPRPFDDVADGLQAKFSIPYLTAFALLRGAPGVDDLRGVDADDPRLRRGARARDRGRPARRERGAPRARAERRDARRRRRVDRVARAADERRAARREGLRSCSGAMPAGVARRPQRARCDGACSGPGGLSTPLLSMERCSIPLHARQFSWVPP